MLNSIRPHINNLLKDARWQVDIEDCDHVLRIEHPTDTSSNIIGTLSQLGINCEELQ